MIHSYHLDQNRDWLSLDGSFWRELTRDDVDADDDDRGRVGVLRDSPYQYLDE